MHVRRLHLVQQALRLAAITVLLVPLPGCQSIVVGTSQVTELRIIDASPDAPGLDIYQNTNALTYNMGFGTVSSYVPLTPGTYTIAANTSGSKQQLVSAKGTLGNAHQYTALIGNVAAGLQELILLDQSAPAASGEVAIRLIDQSTRTGAVDIYLVPAGTKTTAVNPLVTNVAFGTNTGYLNVPNGDYSLVLLPTGTVPTASTTATYTGATITYPVGAARTIVLLDQILVDNPGFQVVLTDDYDSPTSTQ